VTDFLQDYPDGMIVAMDEMSLYFQATLTHVWSPVGQTPLVRVAPPSATWSISLAHSTCGPARKSP